MIDQPSASSPPPRRGIPLLGALFVVTAVFSCSIWANLSFALTNKANYRYIPPFQAHVNANGNQHLGGEYFQMARSLTEGQGFSHPFDRPTGPTAWQPPLLPAFLACLLWACDGDRNGVTAVVVLLQVYVLIATGLLILALVRRTTTRLGAGLAATAFFFALLCQFRLCFQSTHDSWLVLLALDLLIAGLCWLRPLERWRTAAGWGLFGGMCALVSPVVGFTWGLLSLVCGFRQRAWSRLALAVLAAGLTVAPWTVRNYLVFGRLIPIKSNLAYEMYQTHNLQKDGLLLGSTFRFHPYGASRRERKEYNELGETAFLDRKRQQFWQAVRADPLDYADRVARRFLGATLWYVPFWASESRQPLSLWLNRLTHPLPFLGLLVLMVAAVRERLYAAQWTVIGVYVFYLLPYIGSSYYDRYAMPLLGAKVLLVLWAADRLLGWRRGGRTKSEQNRSRLSAGAATLGVAVPSS